MKFITTLLALALIALPASAASFGGRAGGFSARPSMPSYRPSTFRVPSPRVAPRTQVPIRAYGNTPPYVAPKAQLPHVYPTWSAWFWSWFAVSQMTSNVNAKDEKKP